MPTARARIQALLAPLDQPGQQHNGQVQQQQRQLSCIYLKDGRAGASFLGDPLVLHQVEAGLARLEQAVEGLPASYFGHVRTQVISRTLRLNAQAMKRKVALQTAVAVFPQAQPHLK